MDWTWGVLLTVTSIAALILGILSLVIALRAGSHQRKRGPRGPPGKRGRPGGYDGSTGPSGATGPAGTGGGGGGTGSAAGGTGSYFCFSSDNLGRNTLTILANNLQEGTVVLMGTDNDFNANGPASLRDEVLDTMCATANRPGTLKDLHVVLGGGDTGGFFGGGTGLGQIWVSNSSVIGQTGWAPTPLAVSFPFSETGPQDFYTLSNTTDRVTVAPFDRFALVFTVAIPSMAPMNSPPGTSLTGIGPYQAPLQSAYVFGACSAGLTYF